MTGAPQVQAHGRSEAPAGVPPSGVVCVVFSKDRPLQLEGCLSSMERALSDLPGADVVVVYAASTPGFAGQYRIVGLEHPGTTLRRETDFRADLLSLLRDRRFVLFVVDDTVFLGAATLSAGTSVLDAEPSCLGFSYRLGRNTTYCYSMDRPQALPAFRERGSGVLDYDWPETDYDFGYPLEVSSSMFRTADVLPLLETLPFRNPNTLESVLSAHATDFRETRGRLACYAQSVAVSIPANLVQTVWTNRSAGRPELSADNLAREFGRGRRLDVDAFWGHTSKAAHEVLPFRYVDRADLPVVSVVIPCFNQAAFLPDAIESVVRQTSGDWEIVVVDDGSPDDTAQVAEAIARKHPESHIRTVRQENGGLARARNAGVLEARGRYILPLDADDRLAPAAIERMTRVLDENPHVAIVYSDVRRFGDDDRVIAAGEWDPVSLPIRNHLSYCSLFRREVWDAVGGYNPNMRYGYEDWDFWIGAAERGYVGRRIPEPLFEYRVRAGTMIASAEAHDRELRDQMARNHPAQYRRRARLRRQLILERRRLRHRLLG